MSNQLPSDLSVPSPSVIQQTGVCLKLVDGVPSLAAGERPFWGFIYTFDAYDHHPYLKCVRSMYDQGVRLFSFLLPLPLAWDRPGGEYDFTLLDELHDKIFETAPEALVFPRVFLTTPNWWDEAYPEELIGFRSGRPEVPVFPHEDQPLWKYETKMYHSAKNVSIASTQWRQDAGAALAAYVRHTWEKYPGQFFGYQVAYGTCGEWGAFGSYFANRYGSYDFSRPMVESFRKALTAKYGSDAALRRAWNDRNASLELAEPPTKIQTLETDMGLFKDPRNARHYTDWVDHYCQTLYGAMLHFGRTAKAAAPRPVVTGSFAGYRLQIGCSAYVTHLAQTGLKQLLDSDDLDILSTPNLYESRARGVTSQSCVATVTRKKIFIAENDFRSFVADAGQDIYSSGRDRLRNIAAFRRDTYHGLVHGSGHEWWYDYGQGWYLDPAFVEIVGRLRTVMDTIPAADRRGQAEVALVIDEESQCYMEGGPQYYKLWREVYNERLPRMGAPYDVITFDDMLQRPAYKLYLFRDLFYAPYRKIRAIREFVENNQACCAWFYAAGLLTENGFDLDNARKLTGFKMDLLDFATNQQLTTLKFDHPLTQGIPAIQGTGGNDDIRGVYGPMLFADDPEAVILGQLEAIEKPGFAYRSQDARFDAWFASPLLTWHVWANLARHAGVHLCVPPGTVVYGDGRLILLLADATGPVEFRPRETTGQIENLITGETHAVANGLARIDLTAGEPVLLRLLK